MFEKVIYQFAGAVDAAFVRQKRLIESLQKRYIEKWWLIVATLGSVFIILNTLYLSFLRPVNSDTVAQQLIVHQWLNGVSPNFATLGETNYLLKFPLYAVMESLPLDPFARLVITATVLALAAWILIVYVTSKFTLLLKFNDTQKYILGWLLLFVAVVSNHVMWLHYPNSRTLEVGMMLGVLYWLMRLYMQPATFAKVTFFSLATGALFIGDKYALYIVGILSGLYFMVKLIQAVVARNSNEVAASLRPLMGLSGAAAVFVGGVMVVKSGITPINIQQIVDGRLATASETFNMIPATLAGLLELHGVYIFGQQLLQPSMVLSVLYGLVLGFIMYLLFSKKERKFSVATGLLLSVAIGTIVLFMIGNRATDASAGRYLIIVPFLLIIVASMAVSRRKPELHTLIITSVMLAVIVTLPMTAINVTKQIRAQQWQDTNQAVFDIIDQAHERGALKGYDTFFAAQATTYLSDGEVLSIPVRCESGLTHPIQLLLEAGSIYIPTEKSYVRVSSDPEENLCSQDDIIQQFGTPNDTGTLPDGSNLLFYDRDITPELQPAVM